MPPPCAESRCHTIRAGRFALLLLLPRITERPPRRVGTALRSVRKRVFSDGDVASASRPSSCTKEYTFVVPGLVKMGMCWCLPLPQRLVSLPRTKRRPLLHCPLRDHQSGCPDSLFQQIDLCPHWDLVERQGILFGCDRPHKELSLLTFVAQLLRLFRLASSSLFGKRFIRFASVLCSRCLTLARLILRLAGCLLAGAAAALFGCFARFLWRTGDGCRAVDASAGAFVDCSSCLCHSTSVDLSFRACWLLAKVGNLWGADDLNRTRKE